MSTTNPEMEQTHFRTEDDEEDLFELEDDQGDLPTPSRVPPPFESIPDDDPADADPEYDYDDDRTGPSFDE
jgi:hypothetical protein